MPLSIEIFDCVSMGLDPRNDLVLVGKKIKNKHLLFQIKGENLALYYLGHTNQTFLNHLPLEEGKHYLLNVGDRIQTEGTEIIVYCDRVPFYQHDIKPQIIRPVPDIELLDRHFAKNEPEINPEVIVVPKKIRMTKISHETTSLFVLWPTKVYSVVIDIFITYALLVIVMPILLIESFANDFFIYLASFISIYHSEFSYFPFFIAWYLISFIQTLIFGTTLGQLSVGLKNSCDNSFAELFLNRLKIFFYSLVLVPPQNLVSDHLIFKGIRKFGLPLILLFLVIAPFLLPLPYNSTPTLLSKEGSRTKELHTRSIVSSSKDLNLTLTSELSYRYLLLPVLSGDSKRGFQLIDLKDGNSITIKQGEDFLFHTLEKQLKYANPLYDIFQKNLVITGLIETSKSVIRKYPAVISNEHKKFRILFGPIFRQRHSLKKKFVKV